MQDTKNHQAVTNFNTKAYEERKTRFKKYCQKKITPMKIMAFAHRNSIDKTINVLRVSRTYINMTLQTNYMLCKYYFRLFEAPYNHASSNMKTISLSFPHQIINDKYLDGLYKTIKNFHFKFLDDNFKDMGSFALASDGLDPDEQKHVLNMFHNTIFNSKI